MAFEHVRDYPYPSMFESLEKVQEWSIALWRILQDGQREFQEDLANALEDNWAFKTITGITNDVVADQLGDTLTLSSANATLTIVGTAATDAIAFTWAHLGIEGLSDPGADRIAFWDDGETAMKWLAPDGTTIEISGTTLQVVTGGLDHGGLGGLDDGDHDAVYYTETEIDTWRNSVTQTEMGYLDGVTSDIQTQLDARCLESVLGTSIGAGLLLDGTVLKTDVELQAIAGLTSAADRYIRFTGSGTADLRTYANVLADLSGDAGAAFSWNSQNLTNIAALTCGDITATGTARIDGGISIGIAPVSDSVKISTDGQSAGLFLSFSNTGYMGNSFALYRGRGTNASRDPVDSGDTVGIFDFLAYDGTSFVRCADIRVLMEADATDVGDIVPAYIQFRTCDTAGALATRMKISADGHLSVYDWDDSALREVDFGADDSGGTGYKVLRIPN